MPEEPLSQGFWILAGIWTTLGLAGTAFFFFGKDAALKRRLWPPYLIVTGVLFLVVVWMIDFPQQAMYVALPAVALITILNVKSAQFCDGCGKTLMNQNILSKAEFCSKCGASLSK